MAARLRPIRVVAKIVSKFVIYVRPSACISATSAGWIFVKFGIEDLH